jgi:hypothetical protein
VYLNSTVYTKAKADAASTAEVVGIVSAVADANNFTLTHRGRVTGLSGLTAGSVYFLSAATAGLLTATEPSTVGHVSKPVLVADTTTSGFFLNFRGLVVAASAASVVSDTAYDATSWNGVTDVAPSKNAVRDQVEALSGTYQPLSTSMRFASTLAINDDLSATTNVTTVSGTWAINGGVLRHSNTGVSFEFVRHNTSVPALGWATSCDVRIPTQANSDINAGIALRWNGTDTGTAAYVLVCLQRNGGSGNALALRVSRSNAAFMSYVVSVPVDTWANIEAICFGSLVFVRLDGVTIGTVMVDVGDKSVERVGLTAIQVADFRNFKVRALEADYDALF